MIGFIDFGFVDGDACVTAIIVFPFRRPGAGHADGEYVRFGVEGHLRDEATKTPAVEGDARGIAVEFFDEIVERPQRGLQLGVCRDAANSRFQRGLHSWNCRVDR